MRSAVCAAISRSERDSAGNAYLSALKEKFAALPRALATMRVAHEILSGTMVPPDAVVRMDEALRDVRVRRICAERGLDTLALAGTMEANGVPDAWEMEAGWDQAVFGPARQIQGVEPAVFPDYQELHRILRWVTGEAPTSGRGKIPHSTGGCAAFAVILNRVLGGNGRYVGSGDPALGMCSHVALRLGDFIIDGSGVHKPDAFLRRWSFDDGPREIVDLSEDGDRVRRLASRRHGIDEEAIERDFRAALGPEMAAVPAPMML
jgi:hypothetical protein